jgi:hypothetical protein
MIEWKEARLIQAVRQEEFIRSSIYSGDNLCYDLFV